MKENDFDDFTAFLVDLEFQRTLSCPHLRFDHKNEIKVSFLISDNKSEEAGCDTSNKVSTNHGTSKIALKDSFL